MGSGKLWDQLEAISIKKIETEKWKERHKAKKYKLLYQQEWKKNKQLEKWISILEERMSLILDKSLHY